MTPIELRDKIISAIADKNGTDITTIDLADKSIIADYFVIATGRSTPQVRAVADNVDEKMEEVGIFTLRKEGIREGRWVVLDYGSVIVHIFNAETRDFYCLEKLWENKSILKE